MNDQNERTLAVAGSRRRISRAVQTSSVVILVGSIGWLAWSLRNGITDRAGRPNYELWAAFGACVFLGLPAYIVWQLRVGFGPEARELRVMGGYMLLAGVATNLLGVAGNYFLNTLLPFVVVIWYGIFVIGAAFLIIGSVMVVTGGGANDDLT